MQADELKGLHAEAELSGVAPRVRDDRCVHVASKGVERQKKQGGTLVSVAAQWRWLMTAVYPFWMMV